MIKNPVAPHCQGAMRKLVPTGSEQMLIFEFLTSGAQLPFFFLYIPIKKKRIGKERRRKKKEKNKFTSTDQQTETISQKKRNRTEAHSASNLQFCFNSFVGWQIPATTSVTASAAAAAAASGGSQKKRFGKRQLCLITFMVNMASPSPLGSPVCRSLT